MPTIPLEQRGYVVRTEITDNVGRVSFHHSPIYRTQAEADDIAVRYARPLYAWERKITRTVVTVLTAWPEAEALFHPVQTVEYLEAAE